MFGRGFVTAVLLVLIALACIGIARRFERERRLLARLRQRDALDAARAVSGEDWSEDERDTAAALAAAGVLRVQAGRHYIDGAALADFRRRRIRFAVSGALGALALAALVAVLILGR